MAKSIFVRVQCGDCDIVRVAIDGVVLRVCTDNDQLSYSFRCPLCGGVNVRESNDEIVRLLVRAGASIEEWSLPAELLEPRPQGPALTHDDLLDFHLALEQPDWFDEVVALRRSG